MPREPYIDRCTRVYRRADLSRTTTRFAHLLDPLATPNDEYDDLVPSLCGAESRLWHGTGTWQEQQRAASLPLCEKCQSNASR